MKVSVLPSEKSESESKAICILSCCAIMNIPPLGFLWLLAPILDFLVAPLDSGRLAIGGSHSSEWWELESER